MLPQKREKIWILTIFLLLIAGFAAVATRCALLQTKACEKNRQRAAHQQLKIIPQTCRRGMIVDRQGREFAVSIRTVSIGADPTVVENKIEAAKNLARILDMSGDSIYKTLTQNENTRFRWIKRFVPEAQAEKIKTLNIRGLICLPEYRREYPMNSLAAHVLGYTTIDGKGLEGVEARYNSQLAGTPGLWRLRSDARRRPIGALEPIQPAIDGNIVVLTIDAAVQAIVEEQLAAVVDKFNARAASAIVMDPHSGEILAMANLPTFDPENAGNEPPKNRRNRILTDPIEPGSTFKPFTVAAAIQGGFVTIDQVIYCHEGRYSGKGFGTITEYGNHRYGNLSVADILVRSSNIGSAILAQKMGKKYFYNRLCDFGFDRKTGIDLNGEDSGILRPVSRWTDKEYTLTRVGFGQGVSVTPIQLIRAFCCIANGGTLVQPRIVKGILSPYGDKVLVDYFADNKNQNGFCSNVKSSNIENRIIDETIARSIVTKALKAVVDRKEGTAHIAHLKGYDVFGKTGTAQVASKTHRGYEENKYNSSFIAGAPAEDPKLCVLVTVYEPDRSLHLGYTGGRVAAPTVKEILEQTLAYLNIKPNLPPDSLASNQ